LISTDNAHGVHPNYPERHDANNAPYLNRGVAVKINESQRYASTPQSVRSVLSLFENEGLNPQVFVSRNNIACGSTIGPITSTRVGIPAVDIGVPQLSMHSAREICGVKDAIELTRLLGAHLRASS
jgi:aspartyl aminopeptidase